MFSLLFSKALCDKSNVDITSTENVNSGNCKFTNCQFKDFGDSVRAFQFSQSQITLEVKSCTFTSFRTGNSDGAVFYHDDSGVALDFEKVDITSCYANGMGGAFYYKSTKDIAAPRFSEVTIYGCSCFNRVFYIQGNEKGTLLFNSCNMSKCSTFANEQSQNNIDDGLFLFCNYHSNLNYCDFVSNTAWNYLVSFEHSNANGEILSSSCNHCSFVDNTFHSRHLIIITHEFSTFTECTFNSGFDLFYFKNNGKVKLETCAIE